MAASCTESRLPVDRFENAKGVGATVRLTLQEAADGFRSSALLMEEAAHSGDVVFDGSGKVNLMMAQSLARFVSGEFQELFGEDAKLPGRDVISLKADGQIYREAVPAGVSLLDPDFRNVVPGGTSHYQVEQESEIDRFRTQSGTEKLQRSLFLVRDTDMSTVQALADAYMLGDARIQQTVRQIVNSSAASVA